MKKAYIAPEALFISLAVEDNTNFGEGINDISTTLGGGSDIGDLFQ